MGRRLSATSVGEGVREALRTRMASPAAVAEVVGVFSSGFYVRWPDALFAVGGPAIPAGPLHLVLESDPPAPPEGSRLLVDADRLCTASCEILLAHAPTYRPARPTPTQLVAIAPVLASLHREETVPSDLSAVWADVRAAVAQVDLHLARRWLQGVGTGLTPTGDDVLAALLLYANWLRPTWPVPAGVAALCETTDLSRAFLRWAAVGQSIEPVHALVEAAVQLASVPSGHALGTVRQDRYMAAAGVVASIGGSSGKAMLAGLGLAAASWPVVR